WAGIEAGGTRAAMAGLVGRIRVQRQIKKQRSNKEVASESLVQNHCVLAEPAEAGATGEITFEQRRGVNDRSAAYSRSGLLEFGKELLQPRPQNIVVVSRLCIACDSAKTRWQAVVLLLGRIVIQSHHHDASHFGQD